MAETLRPKDRSLTNSGESVFEKRGTDGVIRLRPGISQVLRTEADDVGLCLIFFRLHFGQRTGAGSTGSCLVFSKN